ncbi:MAG: hypothetical protein ACYTBJ_20720 [Planctomycetota bacterium]
MVVEKSFSQLYKGIFRIFAQISTPCAKNLFIWSINEMDKWNKISLNKSGRGAFNAAHFNASGEKYADGTIKKAVRELLRVGAMVSMSDDGKRESAYMINPYYVWKTKSKIGRYESVKAYINILKENEGNQI